MKISLSILALLIGASLAHAEPRIAMRDGTRAFEKGLFTNAVALFKTAAKEAPAAQLDPSVAQMNRGLRSFVTNSSTPPARHFWPHASHPICTNKEPPSTTQGSVVLSRCKWGWKPEALTD
ncbi:MAG: hypothetical protein M5U15_10165 [Kiritimatiellae bacterium]|nr:hypothetical protein [Kiritimatiellia bacterium]